MQILRYRECRLCHKARAALPTIAHGAELAAVASHEDSGRPASARGALRPAYLYLVEEVALSLGLVASAVQSQSLAGRNAEPNLAGAD